MIATEMKTQTNFRQTVLLNPDQKGPRAEESEQKLAHRIVGQARAIRRLNSLYQVFLAGMNSPNRPIGTMVHAPSIINT